MIVLVAEDNALLAFMIESELAAHGHRVLGPASSAAESLRLVEATAPTLAIVDIDLAGELSGVDLARLLMARWGVPTLFATGQLGVARANGDAAFGVIAKPFSPQSLVRAVEVVGRLLNRESDVELPMDLELLAGQASRAQ